MHATGANLTKISFMITLFEVNLEETDMAVIADVGPRQHRAIIEATDADDADDKQIYTFDGRLRRIGKRFNQNMWLQPAMGLERLSSDEPYPFPRLKRQIRRIWNTHSALMDLLGSIDIDRESEGTRLQRIKFANKYLRDPKVYAAVETILLEQGPKPGFDFTAKWPGKVGTLLEAVRGRYPVAAYPDF